MASRLRGLLFRPREWLAKDEVLLLVPCSSIHTFGMTYPIDVAFIDPAGQVLKAERALPPGHLRSCRGAIMVAERPTHSPASSEAPWFIEGESVSL